MWLSVDQTSSTSGFWAVTQSTSRASVRLCAVEGAVVSEEESARIRGAFLDYYVSTRPDFVLMASHIRITDGALQTPIFSGYVHNAISLLSLLVLATCTTIQRPWRWLTPAPRHGICANCKYDLTALPTSARCPECGEQPPLLAMAANNATRLSYTLPTAAHPGT